MIVYDKEQKEIVIPNGLGNVNIVINQNPECPECPECPEVTTYPTIKEIYNTEDTSTEVSFKATVAVCLQYSTTYRMIVTDHTGAFYIDTNQPYDVGDECIFTGVVRKNNSSNIRYMQRPVIEVLSKNNYVVMPVDAVELTNLSDIYTPNEYGNAEMKYLYYEGVIEKFNSNGNIKITTPESVSERGYITLTASKEEWRTDLVVGDYVRVYMFTANSKDSFIPTDLIKLGTESGDGGECNLEDKFVYPSMGEMDDNGFIVVNPSEGYDGMSRTVIDPQTIYNEGVEEGRNQGGGGSGECNIQNQKRVDLSSEWEVIYPDEGFDGVYEVVVDAGRRAEEWQEQGKNEIINKLQSIDITENGRYSTDEQELRSYIEFDGNSYFDTTIQFGENTKIEVAITKTTFEESEQVIGVANYDLLTAETYGGFGIVIGAGLIYGVFGKAKTNNIPYSFEEEQIITLDRNGLNSSLYGETGWSDESGLIDVGLYGQTIGLGKIKSVVDGWSGVFKGRIRYVKIWTDRNDDTTITLFQPKNMAQGGFGLVNSEGVEYNYIENLGTGTTTYIQEYVNKYGYGWKEINVNINFEPFYNFTNTLIRAMNYSLEVAHSNREIWESDMIEYNNTHPDLTSNGMMFKIPDGNNPITIVYGYRQYSGIFGERGDETIKPFGTTLVTPWVYNENNSPSTEIILPDYWIGGFDCEEVEYIDRVFEGAETIKVFTTLKDLGKSFTSVNTLDLSVLTHLNEGYYDGDCFEMIANSVYDFNVMNNNGISYSNVKLPSNVSQTAIDTWTAKGWIVEIVETE